MKKYNPKQIEKKWQAYWEKSQTFKASDTAKKPKRYVLVEFPYPSGAGLHMGHLRPYVAADTYARFSRLKGFEVVYPIGWDAFGLPAENYAIKTGTHPRLSTAKNIQNAKRQVSSWGLSFDWSREVNTTDPSYYKWTQWIFLQLFKKGLAYEATGPINWCPKDKCGLANEEVVDGKCDRCGTVVEKREMRQWFLRITAYAEKLLEGLKHLPEWPEAVKLQQENWIGKSTGAEIEFQIPNSKFQIRVFTTRPDTVFGATYLVVAPEHKLVASLLENKEFRIKNLEEVQKYIAEAKAKSEISRTDTTKEKTGVELKGIKAINPATKEEIPIWVADYVLGGYGTGAIMAVPAHDERDFEFAKKFNLLVRKVIENLHGETALPFVGEGKVVNSASWMNGLLSSRAFEEIVEELEHLGVATRKTQYKLRDWLFSRQRYWGEPIPIVHCAVCASKVNSKQQTENSKVSDFSFSDQKIWADVLRKRKTVDTRSFDPKGEHADWAEIQVGDVIPLFNKKTKKRVFARVTDVKTFSNLTQLFKAGPEYLARVFPGKKFKSPLQLASAYKKIYSGYPSQIDRYGLSAWGVEVLTIPVPLEEKALPLKLPEVKKYLPTGTGESPLATVENWVNAFCPACKAPAKRETNTMPQWAGSSWYWLRYADPKNRTVFASKSKLKRWTPVDVYFGGMEHTTLHLLYSRFWNQFLHDQKLVTAREPYTKRLPHGIILGPDGDKMSKSKGNVVNPDDIIKRYGADTLRMFEMFLGPHGAQVAWNDSGIVGVRRFLDRVWGLGMQIPNNKTQIPNKFKGSNSQNTNFTNIKTSEVAERALHKLIKKVGEELEEFKFNTCISGLMEFLNEVKDENTSHEDFMKFLIVLYPFAPHIAEELYEMLGGKGSLQQQPWPKYDPKKILALQVEVVVQINGKVRARLQVPAGSSEKAVLEEALKDEKIKIALSGGVLKKQIFVKDRLLNLVV